jgi:hypothetical protein
MIFYFLSESISGGGGNFPPLTLVPSIIIDFEEAIKTRSFSKSLLCFALFKESCTFLSIHCCKSFFIKVSCTVEKALEISRYTAFTPSLIAPKDLEGLSTDMDFEDEKVGVIVIDFEDESVVVVVDFGKNASNSPI